MASVQFAEGQDMVFIRQIIKRAIALTEKYGTPIDLLSLTMDISAAHANGCPLKLKELLHAGDSDFLHDVFGIARHINRKTGELENFFIPRFSKK